MTTTRSATLADVLSAGRTRKQPGGLAAAPPVLTQDDITRRLSEAVQLRTNMVALNALENHGPAPAAEAPGATMTGLAAIITALKTSEAKGEDPTAGLLAILEFVKKNDDATIKTKLSEIEQTLNTPGGNSTLDTIMALKEIGLFEKEKGGGLLDTITALQSLGLIGEKQAAVAPRSIIDELKSAVALVDLIRPPAASTPGTVVRIGDGSLTFGEYLQLEELKDKREERKIEQQQGSERMRSGREILSAMMEALGKAGDSMLAETDPSASGDSQRVPAPRTRPKKLVFDVECDHCEAGNKVTVEDQNNPPRRFTCASCHEDSELFYGDEPEDPKATEPVEIKAKPAAAHAPEEADPKLAVEAV